MDNFNDNPLFRMDTMTVIDAETANKMAKAAHETILKAVNEGHGENVLRKMAQLMVQLYDRNTFIAMNAREVDPEDDPSIPEQMSLPNVH